MKNNQYSKESQLPTTKQLEKELQKEKYKLRYNKLLKNTFYALIIVVSISVLLATLVFPVLKIYGHSMEPTLKQNDIVISVKQNNIRNGDIIAFYYNNNILIKRVIATSSQWVNIDDDGNIYVDDNLLKETYINDKTLGINDLKYPYQVPEDNYFVLGDDRKNSLDSRNSLIGTISKEEIIGKVIFKVWPLNHFGKVKK